MSDSATFSTVHEVQQVEAFEKSLQQLHQMLKAVDKTDMNALKRAVASAATGSAALLQNMATSAEQSGRKLRSLMNSLEGQANLSFSSSIRDQTKAIQNAYEAKLATVGRLTNEEIKLWKTRGANIGALQRQQLAEAEEAARALQAFVARQNASAAATPARVSAGLASIRPAGAADRVRDDSSATLAAMREYYAGQEALATAAMRAANAEMERITRKEASASFSRRSRAIKEAAAAEAAELSKSPEMMALMSRFYNLQDSSAREEIARVARKEASAAFKARSQIIKEEAAKEAQALQSSAEMLNTMRQFYTLQDSSAREEIARVARKEASAAFKARSQAIKEAAAKEAQALQSSAEMLNTMRQFYTLQDSGIKEEMARVARKEASAAFKARSQAIKEAAALEAAELNKSPEMLALMSRFYTQQDASARAERDRIYRKEASAEFKARSAAIKAEKEALTGDNSAAMAELRSQYTTLAGRTAMEALRGSVSKLDPKPVHTMSDAFKKLSVDGNDVHSMARGLASGFNLLWLTWGNLAPLFAGAAISFGVKSVVTLGAQVQNTMETIRTLSEESRTAVAGLNDQMLELARSGPFGPLEVAKAMKTLSLAGLSAEEVGSSIKDVLNFAVAGDTSIEKAADVMTSVATAFSISAKGYNYVGDVIAKTAAVSKSSVDSIGEAFKTASVINKQYGVSLQDVGVGLAALSNLGIQGTAAGTALRNMYVDLSGRTPKVEKALAKFNLELRDSNGRFKDVITIAQSFNTVLDNMQSNIDKKKYLQDVLSERGAKPIIELLDLARQAAKETGSSVDSALEEMRNKILDSHGFMIIAAAEMALTPLNQMKSVSASLQATIVEAFDGLAPVILDVSTRLKEAFSSEEAKSGLANLMTAVANLTVTVVKHLDVIALVGAAYLVFKGAQLAATLMLALEKQMLTATASMTAFTLASSISGSALAGVAGAATSAVGWLAKIAGVLTPLTAIVTAGYLAWELYGMFVGRAGKAADDNLGANYHDQLIKQLQSETARLNENTEAMLANMSVEELRSKKGAEELSKKSKSGAEAAVADAEAKLANLELKLQEARGFTNDNSKAYFGTGAVKNLEKQVELEKSRLEYQKETLQVMQITEDINKQQLRDAAKSESAVAEFLAEKKRRKAEEALGNAKYDPEKSAGRGGRGRQISVPEVTNRLTQIEQEGAAALAIAQSSYEKERQILEGRHQAGIISEGLYQAQLIQLMLNSEETRLAIIKDEEEKRNAERDSTVAKEVERLNMELANFKGNADDRAKYVLSKSMETQGRIDKINAQVQASEMKDARDRAKIEDDKYMRMQKAANEYAGKVFKLQEEQRLASEALDRSNVREAQTRDLANQYSMVTENTMAFVRAEKAAAEAGLQMGFKVEDATLKISDALDKAKKAAADFTLEALASGSWNSDEVQAELSRLRATVVRLEDALVKSAVDGVKQINDAAKAASDRVIDEDTARLNRSLADAVMVGLTEGGEAGSKALRKVIEAELRKPLRMVIDLVIKKGVSGAVGEGVDWLAGVAEKFDFKEASDFLVKSKSSIMEWSDTLSKVPGYLKSLDAISKGKWGEGIGSAVGNYFGGPIGGQIGATIGKAVDKFFGGGGVPKVEGGFNSGSATTSVSQNHWTKEGGFQGGAGDSVAKSTVESLEKSYKSIVTGLGKTAGDLKSGVFYATDPNGKSNTQLLYETRLNGKLVYDRNKVSGGYENVGKSEAELKAALELSTSQALVSALKETDLGPAMNEYLKPLDVATMKIEELTKVLTDVTEVGAFKKSIESLPFEYLSKLSVKTSRIIIDAAEGVDNAIALVTNYFDKFGTAQEKADSLSRSTAQGFAALNITMPKSTEGLREWYKSEVARLGAMDLSVEANAKAYVAILKLANGVDALAAAAEETAKTRASWQDKLDVLMGRKTQEEIDLKNELIDVTDESTRAIIKEVYAENARRAALQKNVDDAETAYAKARASFDRAIDKERKRLTELQTTQKATVDNLQSIFDMLDSAAKDLYQQIATTANLSALSANDLLDAAIQTGILPEKAVLSEAIANAKAGVSNTIYGSQAEADYAKNVLAGKLATLAKNAGEQLTAAEKQLKATEASLEALDKLVEQMDDLVDQARGIDTSVKDVATATREVKDAINTLATAISAQMAYQASLAESAALSKNLTGGIESQSQMNTKPLLVTGGLENNAGSGTSSTYVGGIPSLFGSSATAVGTTSVAAPVASTPEPVPGTTTVTETTTTTTTTTTSNPNRVWSYEGWSDAGTSSVDPYVSRFATGGNHFGGLRIVGENGPEIEATGPARYWTATQTSTILGQNSSGGSTSNDAELAAEIRQLRMDNKLLNQNMQIIANAFDGRQKVNLRVEVV